MISVLAWVGRERRRRQETLAFWLVERPPAFCAEIVRPGEAEAVDDELQQMQARTRRVGMGPRLCARPVSSACVRICACAWA